MPSAIPINGRPTAILWEQIVQSGVRVMNMQSEPSVFKLKSRRKVKPTRKLIMASGLGAALISGSLMPAAPAYANGPCYGGLPNSASQACADCITAYARQLQSDAPCMAGPVDYGACKQAGTC
jgi:hypothetical protein